MRAASGIAIFTVFPYGLFRLDDGGLRLITPTNPDPSLYPALERLTESVFEYVSSNHTTAKEAYAKMPRAFDLPVENFHLVSLTEPEELEPLPEGVVS